MAPAHENLASQVERARVWRSLQSYSADKMHQTAVFWRLTILGGLIFWACLAYGIYSFT